MNDRKCSVRRRTVTVTDAPYSYCDTVSPSLCAMPVQCSQQAPQQCMWVSHCAARITTWVLYILSAGQHTLSGLHTTWLPLLGKTYTVCCVECRIAFIYQDCLRYVLSFLMTWRSSLGPFHVFAVIIIMLQRRAKVDCFFLFLCGLFVHCTLCLKKNPDR